MPDMLRCGGCGHIFQSPIEGSKFQKAPPGSIIVKCPKCENNIDVLNTRVQ